MLAGLVPLAALADTMPSPSVTWNEADFAPSATAPADRGFLYTDDPSLPAPLHVVVSAGLGDVTRTGEERPVGAGAVIPTVSAELGLLPRLSFFASAGAIFWSPAARGTSPATFDAGPRILVTNPGSRDLEVTLTPEVGMDFYGNMQLFLGGSFAWSYRILRLAASAIVSHTFQPGADPLDVQASLGAMVSLPLGFRAGLEGVVTDLEEIATPGAEGGSSVFGGPTLGWAWGRIFQIAAGPAYGFGPNYSGFLGRAMASAQF